jgi:hypothetical protein
MSTTDESKPITLAKLERSIDRVALAMRRAGKKGEVYFPIFERLESEIAAAKGRRKPRRRQPGNEVKRKQANQSGRPPPSGNRGLESEDEDQRVTGSMNPEDAKQPKKTVPFKDHLSLSPEKASLLSGIGLTSIKTATTAARWWPESTARTPSSCLTI